MRKIHWFILAIILLFPLIGILFYPHMPEQMGTHWSFAAKPDGYEDKFSGTFGTAILLMIISGLFGGIHIFISCMVRKYYKHNKLVVLIDWFIISLLLFFLLIYIAVLIWNAGFKFHMPLFILLSCGILILTQSAAIIYILTKKTKAAEKSVKAVIDYNISSEGKYKDDLVKIDDDMIIFKNYYFPTGSKSIKLSQVEYVEEKPCTLKNGKWRLHGTGDLLFRVWFPADYDRPGRDKIFVMKVKNKWIRIGFTVENSEAVSGLFRTKGLLG